jgi:hypothetical protein
MLNDDVGQLELLSRSWLEGIPSKPCAHGQVPTLSNLRAGQELTISVSEVQSEGEKLLSADLAGAQGAAGHLIMKLQTLPGAEAALAMFTDSGAAIIDRLGNNSVLGTRGAGLAERSRACCQMLMSGKDKCVATARGVGVPAEEVVGVDCTKLGSVQKLMQNVVVLAGVMRAQTDNKKGTKVVRYELNVSLDLLEKTLRMVENDKVP